MLGVDVENGFDFPEVISDQHLSLGIKIPGFSNDVTFLLGTRVSVGTAEHWAHLQIQLQVPVLSLTGGDWFL